MPTQLGVVTPSEGLSFALSEPVEIQVADAVAVFQIQKLFKNSEQPQIVIFCDNVSVICSVNRLNTLNPMLYKYNFLNSC